jgi:predicted dehydrogenase
MSNYDLKPIGGRVALVGTGHRAEMYVRGIALRPSSTIVAICEPNSIRAAYYNDLLVSLGMKTVPVYKPDDFKRMLQEANVEVVVVTCIDALHDLYIVPALEAGGKHLSIHCFNRRTYLTYSPCSH